MPDNKRKQEVELFLDLKGPQRDEARDRWPAAGGSGSEITQVNEEPRRRAPFRNEKPIRGASMPEYRHEGQEAYDAVVQRKDAQRSANIVRTIVIGVATGVEQDACDQKATQYKERIHCDPGLELQMPDED